MPSYNFNLTSPQEVAADLLMLLVSSEFSLGLIVDAPTQVLLAQEGFEAKAGQHVLLRAPQGFEAKRVLLLGVGDLDEAAGLVKKAVATGSKQAMSLRSKDLAIGWTSDLDATLDVTAVVEGQRLGRTTSRST